MGVNSLHSAERFAYMLKLVSTLWLESEDPLKYSEVLEPAQLVYLFSLDNFCDSWQPLKKLALEDLGALQERGAQCRFIEGATFIVLQIQLTAWP